MADNNKVVIIGANGTMGAGAGCVFAGAGYNVTMLARSAGKAAEGLTDAQNDARAEAIAERIALGSYDADLGRTVGEAGFVFESLAEDLPLKKHFFELVDKSRRPRRDYRNWFVGTFDRGNGAGAQRFVSPQFPGRASVQPAACDRRHRGNSRTRHRPRGASRASSRC